MKRTKSAPWLQLLDQIFIVQQSIEYNARA